MKGFRLVKVLAGPCHARKLGLQPISFPVKSGNLAQEFILLHRLYRSDRTGAIINPRFLMLSYPSRWFYDILRALDYFRSVGAAYDPRMQDALAVLRQKRRKDGAWPLQAKHSGQTHFDMEIPGQPSRWNTLRALRVLRRFGFTASSQTVV